MKLILFDSNPLEGETYRHVFSNIFKDSAANVEFIGQAFTAKQGIELVKKTVPDVVFLDTDISGDMDWLSLIVALKGISPKMKIVIITLIGDFELLHGAFRYGIYDYYLKPMSLKDLADLIAKLQKNIDPAASKTGRDGYGHLASLVCSPNKGDAQGALDSFWAVVKENNSTLSSASFQCAEFATSVFQISNSSAEHPSPLAPLYTQFMKQLCGCNQMEQIHKSLETFINMCSQAFSSDTLQPATKQVAKAKELIELYIQQEKQISLESIANEIHISPFYLSRIFKKTEGTNFLDYLLDCRIERAKLLLSTTGDTIISIALSCGYSEVNSFYRLFKKKTGFTPSEYRKRIKSAKQ